MPWRGVSVSEQRPRFLEDYQLNYYSITEIAERFSISRKTAHTHPGHQGKWIDRFKKHGQAGFHEHSRRPHSCPWQTDATIPPGSSLRGQQRKLDRYREEFNQERPHEALEMKRPGEVYQSSGRTMPKRIEPHDYPAHYLVRRVSAPDRVGWAIVGTSSGGRL